MSDEARPQVQDATLLREFIQAGVEEADARSRLNDAKSAYRRAKARRRAFETQWWDLVQDARDGQLSIQFAQAAGGE